MISAETNPASAVLEPEALSAVTRSAWPRGAVILRQVIRPDLEHLSGVHCGSTALRASGVEISVTLGLGAGLARALAAGERAFHEGVAARAP